jgi:Rieske 2Fe-2S family protein
VSAVAPANTRPEISAEVRTLPTRYYTDPVWFDRELESIFCDMWLAAGRTEEIQATGSYFQRQVGNARVIVLRDETGAVSAFHNVCRHRGTLLCREPEGRFKGSIQCPYHAWTYAFDRWPLARVPEEPSLYARGGSD